MNLIQKIYEEMSTDSDGDDRQAEILQNEYTAATVDQQKQLTGCLSHSAVGV